MQIVIDINELDFEVVKEVNELGGEWKTDIAGKCMKAIANGTPLPKGHGRLIDADELYKQEKEEWLCPNNAPFISTDYAHVFAEIDNAPTIIEADKELKDEKL